MTEWQVGDNPLLPIPETGRINLIFSTDRRCWCKESENLGLVRALETLNSQHCKKNLPFSHPQPGCH
jgi:hypothetical protein